MRAFAARSRVADKFLVGALLERLEGRPDHAQPHPAAGALVRIGCYSDAEVQLGQNRRR